ncbi:LOW QUALITY PROTEIN: UDP-galactopyranose mutase-like [Mercenaria mercenaria]|uniref:LOW QUALITY PROTEIN: UDP-galactopyranose mutase-like n=1 Tax=Mercenaria mercenaria TaxID=6596 RepID=UPI00234EC80E|nr:LOW QUALITY PROTEIN: UDP-galactopyranose mutase-like [Mercenaria mercenaria]
MEANKCTLKMIIVSGTLLIYIVSLFVLSTELKKNDFLPLMIRLEHDQNFDICVVGAGLSGAVIAEDRYATTTNKSIIVMEKRSHVGGNCYDYIDDETKIRVSKYGAHIFHTKYKHVWEYVQYFSEWVPYEHKVLALVKEKYVPIPVNIDTVNTLFNLHIKSVKEMISWLKNEQVHYNHTPLNSEEMALFRIGSNLYELLFKPYTIKQWNKTPAELGPSVLARIPVRNNWDTRYFSDQFQGLPKKGYTGFIKNMLKSPQITIRLNMDYFDVQRSIKCGKTYFTGPVDRYYAKKGLTALEYRSLSFERKVIKTVNHFQPTSVVNHPDPEDNFTRIVEYKWFPNQQYQSNDTIVFIERSTDNGEPYYPVPNKRNQDLYNRYKVFANSDSYIHFLGRLANYKYFNMDEAIKNALEMFSNTVNNVF